MLKRFITSCALVAVAAQPLGASATDLDKAFSSFGGSATYSGPGTYSSSTRTTFVAGGVEARFPRSTTRISLLSITPPTMPTAGCGGISAHFGGFSFVSGAQIEQLIKNIGQNAVGVAVGVVLKELCPICQSVISEMTSLAQAASKLSIDSCAVATNLVSKLAQDDRGDSSPALKATCGSYAQTAGKSQDSLSIMQGIDSVCGDLNKAMGTVQGFINSMEGLDKDGKPTSTKPTPEQRQAAAEVKYLNAWGNKTWNTLNALYGPLRTPIGESGVAEPIPGATSLELTGDELQTAFRNRMLLLNLIGTEIVTKPGDTRGNAMPFQDVVNKSLSPKNLFDLFMCGAAPAYNEAGNPVEFAQTSNSRVYCKDFYNGSKGGYNWVLWECPEKDNAGLDNMGSCVLMKPVALQDTSILRGLGFLPQTEILLRKAVQAVRENDPKGFDPAFIKLTQTVNFPIYQAVNAAAVYPASTDDLLSTMSILVSESLVYAQLEDLLAAQGRNPQYAALQRESAVRVYQALEEVNRAHLSQRESYGRLMTMQEGAVQAIRQVNLAIQKQVLTPELLGNTRFGASAVKSVTPPAAK